MNRRLSATSLAVCAALLSACASTPSAPSRPIGEPIPDRTPDEQPAAKLPAIPTVDGPLQLDVAYPPQGSSIAASDSNFIFGSTGSGRAQLTINGISVPVAPNGGFLAFMPVPSDGVYRLNATKNGESATLERTVSVPATRPGGGVSGFYPTGTLAVQQGEIVEFGLRAPPGTRSTLILPDGQRVPLVEQGGAIESLPGDEFRTDANARRPSTVRHAAAVRITTPIVSEDTSLARPRVGSFASAPRTGGPLGSPMAGAAIIQTVFDADTMYTSLPLNVGVMSGVPRIGVVTPPANPPSDWAIRGRVDIAGPFHFFWPAGTYLTITGERSGMYRVRLAGDRSAWVPAGEVRLLPEGAPSATGAVNAVRFDPQPDFIDVRIPLPARMPFQVVEEENALHIDVFGATSRINFFQYGGLDPLIGRAEWSQPADGVLRVSAWLTDPVWGYAPFYDASGALVLRIRRPPAIDSAAPLRGLYIAVDAGHGGEDRSTRGPTDLREADANLYVALQLQRLLEAAGARVLMTRTTDATVPLNDRPRIAADSGVHVLVSVHNNAFPDGVNPWTNNGTSAYYFHPRSAELARLMQRELLAELGLRDIGYGRADLALVRPTWMPAVLTETAFMMMPEQEAALRDPTVQQRIAQAHVRALEAFLRARAGN